MSNAAESLSQAQLRYIAQFADAYTARTRGSAAARRGAWPFLADPRSSSGYSIHGSRAMREFWAATKCIRYPIVGRRCAGSRAWDIDGNEYIDFGLGFGVYMFGHNPDFIVEAMHRRIDAGMPMGLQSDVARDVAEQIARMTGTDRVAYCNTGAESVMVALRLARAVTGRDKIVVFASSYHGSYDATIPGLGVLLGVTPGVTQDTIVLEYGADAALRRIDELGDQLAAVLVEPVQGRQPWLQPAAFLTEVRRITAEHGTALIFDEVLLGFRIHQGGCQAHFGIKADLATYSKIIGGGMPIGVVAGSARFMDPIDGGAWRDTDDSLPDVDKIWYSGTFAKNPLTMACAEAVVERFWRDGPALQERLNQRAEALVDRLSIWLREHGTPISIARIGSMFRFIGPPPMTLLIPHLATRGIYTAENMLFFISVAHHDNDLVALEEAVKDSLRAMRQGGYLA
ncbi:MAG TPA: aminotransferase class III-fold pyridoxal phosphate-dependent enzyme [Kofleriaceae bacterium]|nr:aminotransferase class III-fold pyridoxal phosphate-dependent enzyme [Kofleriaceae bacterium]